MARTQTRGGQILDGTIKRKDLNTDNATNAVITKIIAGNNISITETGAASGTGDVTVNLTDNNYIQLINDSLISISSSTPTIMTGMSTPFNIVSNTKIKISLSIAFSIQGNSSVFFQLFENNTELTDASFSFERVINSNSGGSQHHNLVYMLTNPTIGNNDYSIRWFTNGSGTAYSQKRTLLVENFR